MRQVQAKNGIRIIWQNWADTKQKYDNNFGLYLHSHLTKNHPDLLSFRYSGDKYQLIVIWGAFAASMLSIPKNSPTTSKVIASLSLSLGGHPVIATPHLKNVGASLPLSYNTHE